VPAASIVRTIAGSASLLVISTSMSDHGAKRMKMSSSSMSASSYRSLMSPVSPMIKPMGMAARQIVSVIRDQELSPSTGAAA
jgi:hypothetical protein